MLGWHGEIQCRDLCTKVCYLYCESYSVRYDKYLCAARARVLWWICQHHVSTQFLAQFPCTVQSVCFEPRPAHASISYGCKVQFSEGTLSDWQPLRQDHARSQASTTRLALRCNACLETGSASWRLWLYQTYGRAMRSFHRLGIPMLVSGRLCWWFSVWLWCRCARFLLTSWCSSIVRSCIFCFVSKRKIEHRACTQQCTTHAIVGRNTALGSVLHEQRGRVCQADTAAHHIACHHHHHGTLCQQGDKKEQFKRHQLLLHTTPPVTCSPYQRFANFHLITHEQLAEHRVDDQQLPHTTPPVSCSNFYTTHTNS